MSETSAEHEIVLSLISHTNVGKTALARTLLRRDVGEVAVTVRRLQRDQRRASWRVWTMD